MSPALARCILAQPAAILRVLDSFQTSRNDLQHKDLGMGVSERLMQPTPPAQKRFARKGGVELYRAGTWDVVVRHELAAMLVIRQQ